MSTQVCACQHFTKVCNINIQGGFDVNTDRILTNTVSSRWGILMMSLFGVSHIVEQFAYISLK